MITRVRVKNFRSLADVDVTLEPLTVLVGRNGAGKSSFIDTLRFVRDALHDGVAEAFAKRYGFSLVKHQPSPEISGISVDLEVDDHEFAAEYGFTIRAVTDRQFDVVREICRVGRSRSSLDTIFCSEQGQWRVMPPNVFSPDAEARIPMKLDAGDLFLRKLAIVSPLELGTTFLSHLITSTQFYAPFPESFRPPQIDTSAYALFDDGSNLASVLQRLQANGQYPDLVASLSKIVDGVNDLRVKSLGHYLVTEVKHDRYDGTSRWSELAQESDGTIRTLVLLVALYHDTARALVAIEEPEIALHPGALGVISDVIKEAATRSQVLITTQSPDLISRFSADQLRIVEIIDDATRIGPLEETQREVINEQLFSAGDLLRIEGLHSGPVVVGEKDHA